MSKKLEKPKARKAPAANGAEPDPVFAAIAEHKRLRKELARRDNIYRTARDQAEKSTGGNGMLESR